MAARMRRRLSAERSRRPSTFGDATLSVSGFKGSLFKGALRNFNPVCIRVDYSPVQEMEGPPANFQCNPCHIRAN